MKKSSSSMTATRLRYHVIPECGAYGIRRIMFRCAKKSAALRIAKKHQPADITDTMAKVGASQVWRVDGDGVQCVARRSV